MKKSFDVTPRFAPVLLGKIGLSPHDEAFAVQFPILHQLMMPVYEEKKLLREPGIIGVRVDGSLFRMTVICPTEGVQTVMETSSILNILEQLERHAAAPGTTWTPTFDSKKRSRRGLDRIASEE